MGSHFFGDMGGGEYSVKLGVTKTEFLLTTSNTISTRQVMRIKKILIRRLLIVDLIPNSPN